MRTVDGAALSPGERQLLAVLEAELRVDVELDLRLRTMRHHQVRAVLGPVCRAVLAALVTVGVLLAGAVRWVGRLAATAWVIVRPSFNDGRTITPPHRPTFR
ncbi:hypothetical protein [Kitasatospora sp. NPDC088134]|uniref:hypothetical protein n=1 Tax=Kitasatospora sp. NPDC088134 TaxID=3364071 RepID=UPI0038173B51